MPLRLVHTIEEVRRHHDEVRAKGGAVGLVPTMGYLHEGHTSLMAASAATCATTTASVFVNPLQFGADEDLAAYPRDLDRDRELAAAAGVDLLFVPDVAEMYPAGAPPLTSVRVDALDRRWEGERRPGHFQGVATVVAKLFAIAGPCRAYFGEKDYQQLQVVRRMAADLNLAVEVVGCPTVREEDGLAMSSRNTYLSAPERLAALCLHRALAAGVALVAGGERRPEAVDAAMAAVVGDEPLARLDYAAIVDRATLEPAEAPLVPREYRLLIAAQVGRPRLLDNAPVVVA
jgi:pantoate--beta-alanine ligase